MLNPLWSRLWLSLLVEKIGEASARWSVPEEGLCCRSAAIFRERCAAKTSCKTRTILATPVAFRMFESFISNLIFLLRSLGLLLELQDGKIDLSFFSADCFHFTVKGHEELAKGLWNNMVTVLQWFSAHTFKRSVSHQTEKDWNVSSVPAWRRETEDRDVLRADRTHLPSEGSTPPRVFRGFHLSGVCVNNLCVFLVPCLQEHPYIYTRVDSSAATRKRFSVVTLMSLVSVFNYL